MRKSDMRKAIQAAMDQSGIKPHYWGMTGEDQPLEVSVLRGTDKLQLRFPHGLTQWQFAEQMKKIEEFVGHGSIMQGLSAH